MSAAETLCVDSVQFVLVLLCPVISLGEKKCNKQAIKQYDNKNNMTIKMRLQKCNLCNVVVKTGTITTCESKTAPSLSTLLTVRQMSILSFNFLVDYLHHSIIVHTQVT